MATGSITPYDFYLVSEKDNFIDTSSFPLKAWHRAVTLDTIFRFYSYLEININDEMGTIIGKVVNGEGQIVESYLGVTADELNNWLVGRWVWDSNQVIDCKPAKHIRGNSIISFFSHYYMYDAVKTRVWNDTISNIVATILKDDYKIPVSDIVVGGNYDKKNALAFVTPTTGKNVYYQINESNSEFIKRLATRAYSEKYEYSPFVTFTNSKKEIYFCALEELYNKGEVISKEIYKLTDDQDTSTNPFSIRKIEFLQTGLVANKPTYKKKIYNQKSTGVVGSEVTQLKDHSVSREKGKILIHKDNLEYQKIAFSYEDFGLYNEATETSLLKGYRNSFYVDSMLYLRLNIDIIFNSKAVTGKTIDIEIGSNIDERNNKTSEFCGKWLIIKSQHYWDSRGLPIHHLELAKNRAVPDSTVNVFKNNFIS